MIARRGPKEGSQCHTVLHFIQRHGAITPADAIQFGCYRLAARVKDLRDMGYNIITRAKKHDGGTHARYEFDRSDYQREVSGQMSFFG